MTIPPLETEHATAAYDIALGIVRVAYFGDLDGEVTLQVYDWLDNLYDAVGLDHVHGQIFDFRKVTKFDESNLKTARRTSSKMNMGHDTSHIPVAMIVGGYDHEELLRTEMRIPLHHARKRIVHNEDDAVTFLQDFWSKQVE